MEKLINFLLENEKGEIVGYTHTSREADDICKIFPELQWYKNKKLKTDVSYFNKHEYKQFQLRAKLSQRVSH